MRCNTVYLTTAILLLVVLNSCNNSTKTADDGVYFQDFDNLRFWAREESNLTNERAHSGDFSAHTDSTFEYGQTFEMEYSYAKSKGYKAMTVSAWAFASSIDAKGGLISSVESIKGTSAYVSADFKDFITAPDQWEKISSYLRLPENAPEGSKIKVYLWSPNKSKLFLDDVTVKFSK